MEGIRVTFFAMTMERRALGPSQAGRGRPVLPRHWGGERLLGTEDALKRRIVGALSVWRGHSCLRGQRFHCTHADKSVRATRNTVLTIFVITTIFQSG